MSGSPIWFDGKLILNRTDVRTRTSAEPSSMRPNTVGWYNSHGANADGILKNAPKSAHGFFVVPKVVE